MLPWHRPSRFADPAWATDWVQLYDTGSDSLVLLDTGRIELAPSEMLAQHRMTAT